MCTIEKSCCFSRPLMRRNLSWRSRAEFKALMRRLKLANDWRALAVVNHELGSRRTPHRRAAYLASIMPSDGLLKSLFATDITSELASAGHAELAKKGPWKVRRWAIRITTGHIGNVREMTADLDGNVVHGHSLRVGEGPVFFPTWELAEKQGWKVYTDVSVSPSDAKIHSYWGVSNIDAWATIQVYAEWGHFSGV